MNFNLNILAKQISELEGKKVQLSIAQIKEVLKCLGIILGRMSRADMLNLVSRIVRKYEG